MSDQQHEPPSLTWWDRFKVMTPSIQLLTNLAVVAGIAALLLELIQTRELARVQTFDSAYLAAISRNLSFVGESPERSLARSIFEPDAITPTDVIVLNQYYTAIVVNWRRMKDPQAMGYFGGDWRAVVSAESLSFNTVVGRRWLENYRQLADPEIFDIVDQSLANTNVNEALAFYRRLLPKKEGE